MEKKNLALEALKKLLNDEISSRSKSNIVESKQFSDRLQEAVARYHTNAISTVEVLQELIQIAKDIKTARQRGEEEGLSHDEVAFYAALAENESAVDVMGNDSLKIIAHELLEGLKSNISVDWSRRDSARARMRVLVKRILRRHGYPPDLQDAAIRTVLLQAETELGIDNAKTIDSYTYEPSPKPNLGVHLGVHGKITLGNIHYSNDLPPKSQSLMPPINLIKGLS